MTLEPTDTSDSGALSIDQAADLMNAQEEETNQPVETPEAAPAETQDTEAVPAAEDGTEVETPDGAETAEAVEAETPIDPPQFWNTDAKARFRELPRDLQEVVLSQETSRNAFTSKAAQEANETRKAADAEKTRFSQLAEQLGTLVPQAEKTFADRWANVDWVALTDQVGAEQAQKLKFQHDAEREQLASLKTAQAQSEKATFDEFVKREAAILPTLCPDLTDAKEGPARRQALGQYLVEAGIAPQALSGISAREMSIAWKAKQWDDAQAKIKAAAAKPKSAAVQPQAKTAASRPTTPAAASSPTTQRIQTLERKRSLSIDEATELMNLKDQKK